MNGTATAPLDAKAVLGALRRAGPDVAAAERTEDALARVVEALVPHAADHAAAYVMERDGCLRLKAAAPHMDTGTDQGHGSDGQGAADGVAPARNHPAQVAIREAAPAGRFGGGTHRFEGNGQGESEDAAGIALPLLRDDRAVGALWLERDGNRRYGREDLELLLELGERVSQMLEIRRLRLEVRAAQRAKADFLAVVNHELRTPLTAVVGYADLLEAGIPGPVTEKQRRQLVRIKESAWDLLELIDGILGYARYEGESPELQVRQVDPETLLQDALRVVEGAAEEKGLTLRVEAEGGLPTFPTDPEKARRVLFHLLSNAVKFTPEGEVSVRIRAEPEWVVFSVTDTGIGIRPEERSSIFEPFWQGERPETRTAGGAGMGLSLAQKLTEILSGRIEVDSEVGQGSTFTVRFPREGPRPASL